MSYTKQNPESIQKMFGTIARRYDLTNSVLSFHLHKLWNKKLVDFVLKEDRDVCLLDLCAGTGEISFKYLEGFGSRERQKVLLVDFCQEMLDCAQEKAEKKNYSDLHELEYIQADVQAMPLKDGIATHATMAYGIRNVKEPLVCMREVYRVLKKGGKFGILELTQPENRILRLGHKIHLKMFLPLLGKLVTSNKEAYQYLCNSIHHFIKPEKVEGLLKEAGFVRTSKKALSGGIAHIIYGEKD